MKFRSQITLFLFSRFEHQHVWSGDAIKWKVLDFNGEREKNAHQFAATPSVGQSRRALHLINLWWSAKITGARTQQHFKRHKLENINEKAHHRRDLSKLHRRFVGNLCRFSREKSLKNRHFYYYRNRQSSLFSKGDGRLVNELNSTGFVRCSATSLSFATSLCSQNE